MEIAELQTVKQFYSVKIFFKNNDTKRSSALCRHNRPLTPFMQYSRPI
jgi:hypothetical protein